MNGTSIAERAHAERLLPQAPYDDETRPKRGATHRLAESLQVMSDGGSDTGAPLIDALFMPAPPAMRVTRAEAEQALTSVFGALDVRAPAASAARVMGTVADANALAMEAVMLSLAALGDMAQAKSRALEIQTDRQIAATLQKVEDYREQLRKAAEDADKAEKGGIFTVVFDWAIGSAEVASGIVKLAIGDYAGGSMDLMAGVTGLAKASLETAAMLDSENADKYREVADVLGKIQLGFEIAGMMVDVVSVGRILWAAKGIGGMTKNVLATGMSAAGENFGTKLSTLISAGDKQGIAALAREIGKQVADNVADQVAASLTQLFRNGARQGGAAAARNVAEAALKKMAELRDLVAQAAMKKALEAFNNAAIERMVANSIEAAAASLAKKGAAPAQEVLEKAVGTALRKQLLSAATRVQTTIASMLRQLPVAGQQITDGAITIERAKLQKRIAELLLDMEFLQYVIDHAQRERDSTVEDIKDLLAKQASVGRSGNDSLATLRASMMQIAGNLA